MRQANFSDWLMSELSERGMSQADLARSSGLSEGHISKIINGDRLPGIEAIFNIARGLNIPVELVNQKLNLFKFQGLDATIDILATEVSTMLVKLDEDDRRLVQEVTRYLYTRQKRNKPA